MKKYRLKQDTALYPKGTIAERHDEDLYYVLRRNNGQELKRRILNNTTAILDLWQVEENEVWEEITEDQREEEVDTTLYDVDDRDMEVFKEIQAYEKAEKLLKNTKFGKEGGSCFECCDYEEMYEELAILLSRHIGGGDEKVDHQVLREESLKKGFVREMEPLNENNKVVFGVVVHEKYADAWRALLDNQKE